MKVLSLCIWVVILLKHAYNCWTVATKQTPSIYSWSFLSWFADQLWPEMFNNLCRSTNYEKGHCLLLNLFIAFSFSKPPYYHPIVATPHIFLDYCLYVFNIEKNNSLCSPSEKMQFLIMFSHHIHSVSTKMTRKLNREFSFPENEATSSPSKTLILQKNSKNES